VLGESAELGELLPHALVSGQLVTARLILLDRGKLHPALLPLFEQHKHFQGVTGVVDRRPD